MISLGTEKCYAITDDCAEIAWRFLGAQRSKVDLMFLGVDTTLFHPVRRDSTRQNREDLRQQLGFSEDEIVCVHSGKFTDFYDPLLLAQAVERLRALGHQYRALFIGGGPQKERIAGRAGSVVLDFMPWGDLPRYYRASDIAAWPTTMSTSMLDAAAYGLPLVCDEGVYRDPVEGNGFICRGRDVDSIMGALLKLKDPMVRRQLGAAAARKMEHKFTMDSVADRRLRDYRRALGMVEGSEPMPQPRTRETGTRASSA